MFRTPVIPAKSSKKITLNDPLFLIGSCFSEHIGKRLSENKFDNLTNPFGTIYNPVSIFALMENSLLEKPTDKKKILENQGVYRHYDFHSDISSLSEDDLRTQIEESNKYSKIYLLRSKWIILTLGTAIVYRHKKLDTIVGNCHKVPAAEFDKQRLHPDEIIERFKTFYATLGTMNKDCNIILTVSPVRHIKDSLETNSISKSILRYASAVIAETWDNVHYFPSYEMLIDDLRDYRFYTADMVHPSDAAVDYIWEAFQQSYFSEESMQFIRDWHKIRAALSHKPFYPGSREHQQFVRNTIKQLQKFSDRVDISYELKLLEEQIL